MRLALLLLLLSTLAVGAAADEEKYPQLVLETEGPLSGSGPAHGRSVVRARGCKGLMKVYFKTTPDGQWAHVSSTFFDFLAPELESCEITELKGWALCGIPDNQDEDAKLGSFRRRLAAETPNLGKKFQERLGEMIVAGEAGDFYRQNHTISHWPDRMYYFHAPKPFDLFVSGDNLPAAVETLRRHRDEHCPVG